MIAHKTAKLNQNLILRLYRCYLTSSYNSTFANAAKSMPQASVNFLPNQQKSIAIEVDMFANKLNNQTDRHREILDNFHNLRLSEDATNVIESVSYKVVDHLINTDNVDQLLYVLANRLRFGIFVDKFVGCYLMNRFLQNGNFDYAAKIAVELMLQEDLDNDVVLGLSLISCYQHLQTTSFDEVKNDEQPKVNTKEKEKKIRVKYIRNECETKTDSEIIGANFSKISLKKEMLDIQYDLKLIGSLLAKQYSSVIDFMKTNQFSIHAETRDICQKILKSLLQNDNHAEMDNLLTNISIHNGSIKEKLDAFTKSAIKNGEEKLIAEQMQKQTLWMQQREELFKHELSVSENKSRISNINNIMEDIDHNIQKLRFFKLEDQLDLDIYRKRPKYPKRWFGKKKNPRVMDDGYIPPDITNKN